MAVVTLHGFRTEPGRTADHMASTAEAITHLRRLGLQAVAMQPIAGSDVGTISVSVNYANNAAHAASIQQVQADSGWQDFWANSAASAASTLVESSVFSDLDTAFQPSTDRPLGVILATQWRARPGRLADFVANVVTSVPHTVRMGGLTRTMQSVIGAHPMTMLITTTFADLDAYGAYSDKLADDAQWQEFWAGAMADPSGDLIRSGVYVNISDA
jgi:hypothetical protein